MTHSRNEPVTRKSVSVTDHGMPNPLTRGGCISEAQSRCTSRPCSEDTGQKPYKATIWRSSRESRRSASGANEETSPGTSIVLPAAMQPALEPA